GLSAQIVEITLPDGTRLALDQYSVHNVLYSIYREKIYEPSPAFEPKPGQVILDIGAQQGIYACRAAKKIGPHGRLYAFEPYPGNHALLARNRMLNNLSNVELFPIALFNRN